MKIAAITTATVMETFDSSSVVGAILSAIVMTYCSMDSTRVPLTKRPSRPSQLAPPSHDRSSQTESPATPGASAPRSTCR